VKWNGRTWTGFMWLRTGEIDMFFFFLIACLVVP
jgi:hypothetical protein